MTFAYEIHATFHSQYSHFRARRWTPLARTGAEEIFENSRTLLRTFGGEEFFVTYEEDGD